MGWFVNVPIIPTVGLDHPLDAIGTAPGASGNHPGARRNAA
jgi:hypothetical protein